MNNENEEEDINVEDISIIEMKNDINEMKKKIEKLEEKIQKEARKKRHVSSSNADICQECLPNDLRI